MGVWGLRLHFSSCVRTWERVDMILASDLLQQQYNYLQLHSRESQDCPSVKDHNKKRVKFGHTSSTKNSFITVDWTPGHTQTNTCWCFMDLGATCVHMCVFTFIIMISMLRISSSVQASSVTYANRWTLGGYISWEWKNMKMLYRNDLMQLQTTNYF